MTAGDLLCPAPGYEEARRPAIARFDDVEPRAVARCRTTDVAAALAYARSGAFGARCAAAATASPALVDDGIVVDVSPRAPRSSPRSTARRRRAASPRVTVSAAPGSTIAAGCGPEVGIAGLTLGGGLGILGRLHGLTADSLLAARVVLADGSVVEASEQSEPDLFWALRGAGGGQFGVVTSLACGRCARPSRRAST